MWKFPEALTSPSPRNPTHDGSLSDRDNVSQAHALKIYQAVQPGADSPLTLLRTDAIQHSRECLAIHPYSLIGDLEDQ